MNDSNRKLKSAEELPTSPGKSKTTDWQKISPLVRRGFAFSELSRELALGMPALCLLMALIEGSSYIWRPIAIVLYAGSILFGFMLIYKMDFLGIFDVIEDIVIVFLHAIIIVLAKLTNDTDLYRYLQFKEKIDEKYENDWEKYELEHFSAMDISSVLLGGILILVGFSQIGRHLSFLVGGFISEQMGYWHWLRFGFSTLLESVLFDLPTIYEWNISEIKAGSIWSRTFVFVFRTTIEFMAVAMILRQANRVWKFWLTQPSKINTPHKNYLTLILPKCAELLIMALWGLPIACGIVGVVKDGLSLKFICFFIKLATPVLFGFWISWRSLRGLMRLPGLWNKLFASVGLIAGILVIWECWPAFRAFFGQ